VRLHPSTKSLSFPKIKILTDGCSLVRAASAAHLERRAGEAAFARSSNARGSNPEACSGKQNFVL
jgi:hypothetical protein